MSDVSYEVSGTSTVNFDQAQSVANAAIVDASSGVCALALEPVHVIIDLTAFVTP